MSIHNNNAVVLIIVLWILIILSALAIGLSRQTAVALQLTKSALGSAKSKYMTLAAVHYAAYQIGRDSKDETTKDSDTQHQCGIVLQEGQEAEEIFRNVRLPGGSFDITHQIDSENDESEVRYGFQDEQSRINLNAMDHSKYKILQHLLTVLGFSGETAQHVASAAVDWRDENDQTFNAPYGAEEAHYSFLYPPYHCKNAPFESLEELMLVRGMTKEIFDRVKPYVTVYPAQGSFLINVNTASKPVLQAWARSYSGARTNTDQSDADALVDKIVSHRSGEDGREATADDRRVVVKDLGLNASEGVIVARMAKEWTETSQFLRMRLQGMDEGSRSSTDVEAVVSREEGRIVFWKRW